jgi:hypothetical protein
MSTYLEVVLNLVGELVHVIDIVYSNDIRVHKSYKSISHRTHFRLTLEHKMKIQ